MMPTALRTKLGVSILLAAAVLQPAAWGFTQPRGPAPRRSPILRAENENKVTQTSNAADAMTEVAANEKGNGKDDNDDEVLQQQLQQQQRRSKPRNQLSPQDMMTALGTSPRRLILGNLAASGIALAGNLFGVTSNLLAAIPEETVEATGLDTYFPRGDFKRCRENGYTFVIPKEWVADTFVALAKAQRQTKALDYQMAPAGSGRQRGGGGGGSMTLPDSAFGPPGRLNRNGVSEQGDTNVSVIKNANLSRFTLKGTLGTPQSAAETLLRVSLAPEGSGRVATLVNAFEDAARQAYQFEYTVDRGARGPPLRAISVIASQDESTLVTMTVVAPDEDWKNAEIASKLRKVASSFHLI